MCNVLLSSRFWSFDNFPQWIVIVNVSVVLINLPRNLLFWEIFGRELYIYTHKHTHTHIYIHTYIHTYILTYIQSNNNWNCMFTLIYFLKEPSIYLMAALSVSTSTTIHYWNCTCMLQIVSLLVVSLKILELLEYP